MNVIDVIMIDDIEENYKSLKNDAAGFNIRLWYSQNLEEGIREIEENKKIAAVILDGKGYLKAKQQKGSETIAHVHQGLLQLRLLEEKQSRYIPKFVLSAWHDALLDTVIAPLYDKNKISDDEYKSKFFAEIRAEVEKTEDYHVRVKYKDVFQALNEYLPKENDGRLHKILLKVDQRVCEEQDFNLIRSVFESVLKTASSIDSKNFLPTILFHRDGRPNYEDCIDFLCGREIKSRKTGQIIFRKQNNPIAHPLIQYSLNFMKSVTSGLSHDYSYAWTKYAYLSAVFALCEFILWFKLYVDTNYERT